MTENETNLEANLLGGKEINIASGKDIYFHRNGICGQPFWTIQFTYGHLNMIGTIGVEENDIVASSCRVLWMGTRTENAPHSIDPTADVVQSTWRGDQFAPFLAKQMNEIFAGEPHPTAPYYPVTLVEA